MRDLLALVGLSGFERRSVTTLSGGEQQRVALARALAPEPRVLLLDEPLGSLDRRLRDRLLDDLDALFAELAVTALYVTHDQAEAFALGDRVAVLRDGRIVQVGTPDDVWAHPADGAVARFLGQSVHDGAAIRPESVAVRRAAAGETGDGVVESAVRTGPTVRLALRLDDGSIARGCDDSARASGARRPCRRRDRPGRGRRASRGRTDRERAVGTGFLAEAAALARIHELGGRMATREAGNGEEQKATARAMWALGDYHRFAKQTVWDVGPVLVEACGITAGQRVLDVAAGTGNVALRAAQAGAEVVASDLTPENLEAGRREARALGLELEWVEADAEALPFADGAFDVVTSSFGAMFAPGHRQVADELVRVCRPGGTIGMANFVPDGTAGQFFEIFGRHAPPPPPGALAAGALGNEEHVRELFGDRVDSLELTRQSYVERSPGDARDYVAFFEETFGPMVALRGLLAAEPEQLAALDEDFRGVRRECERGRTRRDRRVRVRVPPRRRTYPQRLTRRAATMAA